MVRFPDSKNCYVFPLQNQQSGPKKLIRDLVAAKQVRLKLKNKKDFHVNGNTWNTSFRTQIPNINIKTLSH